MERTEEQKVMQAPLKIILGGLPHDIPVLPIKLSRPWRQAVIELIRGSVAQADTIDLDKTKDVMALAKTAMVDNPNGVIDLFFEYAHGLNREEMEEVITDAEIADGFDQMIEVSFPLGQSLAKAMEKMGQPSEKPLKYS